MKDAGQITAIEVQKRNRKRCAIYLDGEYAFGLDASIVLDHGLRKGDRLDADQIQQILLKEERQKIKESAFRYLAGRAHSEKELRDKLLRKGFERARVDEVLAELRRHRFVDDAAFAVQYARNRLLHKPVGAKRLRQELRQKGVPEELAEAALSAAYKERPEEDLARELLRKQVDKNQDLPPLQRKKRLSEFLLRRGFEWELVRDLVEEAVRESSSIG